MKRAELLAPAGSFAALKAAVNAGADAVYIGGRLFGARAYADNPDTDELIEAIGFCHLRGRKLYMTVNTLFKENELNDMLIPYLRPYYEAGLDAVIVQDTGAMKLIGDAFPGLAIHVSTQASITMAEGINKLKRDFPSITRVVPARELSLCELERFRRDTDCELEVFVHGALCYSYSGQCLMSSMIGGRSGNRGRCAQPCRKLYDGKYILSLKDNCLLDSFPLLIEAGIDSFKIEGRMKSPEYTAGVVSVYRKYIDLYYSLGSNKYKEYIEKHPDEFESDLNILKELYNRGGFNHGYLMQHNGADMMCFDRPNHSGTVVGEVTAVRGREAVMRFDANVYAQDVLEIRDGRDRIFEFTLGQGYNRGDFTSCITMKGKTASKGMKVWRTRCNELLKSIDGRYIDKDSTVAVDAVFRGHIGTKALLVMSAKDGGFSAEIEGSEVQPARNAATSREDILKQLKKLGDTGFVLSEAEFDIDEGAFFVMGELNRMRREAAELLKKNIIDSFRRDPVECGTVSRSASAEEEEASAEHLSDSEGNYPPRLCFSVKSERQLGVVARTAHNCDIYYNIDSFDTGVFTRIIETLKGTDARLFVALPYVSRSDVYDRLKVFIGELSSMHPEVGYLARTREETSLLDLMNLKYRTDYNLYVMNRTARAYAVDEYTLPVELNSRELEFTAGPAAEMLVYGYQPVMFSAQCVYKNRFNICGGGRSDDFTVITDETGHEFKCVRQCTFCTNIIYNSAKLDLFRYSEKVMELGSGRLRLDFTFEDDDEIRHAVSMAEAVFIRGEAYKDNDMNGDRLTGGHFNRGVM